ncbi:centromere protein K-like [Synchiropus splendidus]|uniref:centromere protein K-like n=1 Tax=Synchiropus splendidus TaxID=270530 RepID=UPI00237D9CCE|nr:centromere protein K-like [Synchiropus splendidus]
MMADEDGADQLSEAAQTELLLQCEQQFAQLEKIQNEIILTEADWQNPCEVSVNRLMATEAELNQWMSEEPKLLTTNSEVLLKAGKEEMVKLCSELEMVVACCEAKRNKLAETKEVECKWLKEKQQVLDAVTDHFKRLQMERKNQSVNSLLQDMRDKIKKMELYQKKLLDSLGEVLNNHVPAPQNESSSNYKKKKDVEDETSEDLLSLNDILQLLINQFQNSPHDPYITVDSTFWPPYVEILLRFGIAVRHQENNFKIRLETFC